MSDFAFNKLGTLDSIVFRGIIGVEYTLEMFFKNNLNLNLRSNNPILVVDDTVNYILSLSL